MVFVGYRACGKSSLARWLADHHACSAVDVDTEIEALVGRSIPDIFTAEGEPAFRQWEAEALAAVLERPGPVAVATGGGCVELPANRWLLRAAPHAVIYLQVPVPELQRRLQADAGARPALQGRSVVDEVVEVIRRREPWYRAVADLVVDADRPAAAIMGDLRERLPAAFKALDGDHA